jgi:hypothetical protein
MNKNERGFRVISGSGSDQRHRGENHLRAVTAPPPVEPVQLALLGIGPSIRCVLSVGLDGVSGSRLQDLLLSEQVRHVIDLRRSPTFRSDAGLSLQESIRRAVCSYLHVPELANPYLGSPTPDWEKTQKYREHLNSSTESMVNLARLVDDGPVLLLSWQPVHAGSDRAVVIDALRHLGVDFELKIPH